MFTKLRSWTSEFRQKSPFITNHGILSLWVIRKMWALSLDISSGIRQIALSEDWSRIRCAQRLAGHRASFPLLGGKHMRVARIRKS